MLLWLNTNEEDAMKTKNKKTKDLKHSQILMVHVLNSSSKPNSGKPLISHDGVCIVDRNKHGDCCFLSVFYASVNP
ncbi:hypothetical protein L2E82_45986 [Cichorium intybus]|uniref:Uncharacterized protein n=1 Tax=Cichorium intybus TaxID=13427 RepID=A0ACB8ZTH8_CICIN|nr:hypothetical protein L2E82_45986 [Cichorium intybus]